MDPNAKRKLRTSQKILKNQKKKYAGHELTGKSLGVIGCGAIGIQVANLALRFGMKVLWI